MGIFKYMEPKSTKIYHYLERKIIKGDYKPGDKLPSESELCKKFKVSRGPVRAALDQLTAIGLVSKKKGGGSFVCEQDSSSYFNSVLPTLRFNTRDYREILELRCSLDKMSIELCLENHNANDYSELAEIMAAMEREHTIDEYFSLDRTFHTILSGLSGNRLLHNFNLLIWDLLQHCPREEYYAESREVRVAEHRRIYDSIRDNDAELAVLYTLRHLKRMLNQDQQQQDPSEDSHRWNPWLYDTL